MWSFVGEGWIYEVRVIRSSTKETSKRSEQYLREIFVLMVF
jgi:hypothetical protein